MNTNEPDEEINCPAAIKVVNELVEVRLQLAEVKLLLKEINDRSIADHTELIKREKDVNSIPRLNAAYQRGKGAFWAFCVFFGLLTYYITDIFEIVKLRYFAQ